MSNYDDVSITITERDEHSGFSLAVYFPKITPISPSTPDDIAEKLQENLSSSISSRLEAFTKLLNEVARKSTGLQPWQEIDGAITTLAVLLDQGGLDGALDCIRPAANGVEDLARRNNADNPKGIPVRRLK